MFKRNYYKTRIIQKLLLKKVAIYNRRRSKVVLFVIPTGDIINGGVLSITSIYAETKRVLGSTALVGMVNSHKTHPFLKFSQFEHDGFIYHLKDFTKEFASIEDLIIHVPEYYLKEFVNIDLTYFKEWLCRIKSVQINILNQNILSMPSSEYIMNLALKYPYEFTITCAHKKYSNIENAIRYNISYHYLSVFNDPEQYSKKSFKEKKDVIIISPDKHPRKEELIQKLKNELATFEIKIIQGLKYRDYKKLISKAKFSITLGEGLDGYFIEPVFSGAIAFAIYNQDFFTEDFKGSLGVFNSFEEMIENIVRMVKDLDNSKYYTKANNEQFALCSKYYNKNDYINNLHSFYTKRYNILDMKVQINSA